jgi:hypothetical protein
MIWLAHSKRLGKFAWSNKWSLLDPCVELLRVQRDRCRNDDDAWTPAGVGTESRKALLDAVAHGSTVAWRHLNLLGEYDFSAEKLRDSVGIRLPKLGG